MGRRGHLGPLSVVWWVHSYYLLLLFRKQVRKDVLATINSALNPKRKFENTEGGKSMKRKPEIETQVKETSRRAPKEQVVKPSKELKELERIINKQTDKTEVNKYILVVIDPALVSSPPG